MKVKFWGTRGSVPAAATASDIRNKIKLAFSRAGEESFTEFTDDDALEAFLDKLPFSIAGGFGGNSSCVEIMGGNDYVLCDMGSGLRAFGAEIMKQHGPGNPQTYHFFMSHVHWDHIMGFPFFTPAYIPGNKIIVHGCHKELEQALRIQQSAPCFPVPFDVLGSTIEFDYLEPDKTYDIAGLKVTTKTQFHEGGSYGYRFEKDGKSAVYSTDSEHKQEDPDEAKEFADFFHKADVVVFDAMYSLADAISVKEDWGHSSNIIGVELCHMAQAKHFCMFHHEPVFSDTTIEKVLMETRRYEELARPEGQPPMKVSAAYDGLVLEL